jgi:hypothetical protein
MFVILSCCNSKMCVQGQSLHVLVGRTRFKVPRQPGFNAGPGSLMARKASRDSLSVQSRFTAGVFSFCRRASASRTRLHLRRPPIIRAPPRFPIFAVGSLSLVSRFGQAFT